MEEGYRTKFNNFHGFFPGGFYRSESLFSKETINQTLIKDLDEVLKEMDFDIYTYQRLRGGIDYLFQEILDLAQKAAEEGHRKFTEGEEKRKDRLCEEGDLVNKRLDEMMEPVLEKLVKRGHSKQKLVM